MNKSFPIVVGIADRIIASVHRPSFNLKLVLKQLYYNFYNYLEKNSRELSRTATNIYYSHMLSSYSRLIRN